jgi:hypothetical protein
LFSAQDVIGFTELCCCLLVLQWQIISVKVVLLQWK